MANHMMTHTCDNRLQSSVSTCRTSIDTTSPDSAVRCLFGVKLWPALNAASAARQIDKCFGFDTAVEQAQEALLAAKVEASSAYRGVGVVKLMGRSSGFIAMQASLASGAAKTRTARLSFTRWHGTASTAHGDTVCTSSSSLSPLKPP